MMPKAIPIPMLLLLWMFISCNKPQQAQTDTFQTQLLAITVKNLETSLSWYVETLGFEIEKDIEEFPDYGLKIAFLQSGDFHLELLENNNAIDREEILPEDSMMGGPLKLGFRLRDFEETYERLQQMDSITFLAEKGDLPENDIAVDWPTQHFLIQDPDGNYLQFFNGGESNMIPWLIMLTVDKLEQSIHWYTKHFGFQHHQTVGEEGNKRAILERNDYILELYEPETVMTASELSAEIMINGLSKIAFAVPDIQARSTAFEQDGTEIVLPVQKSDFAWADQFMIVKDPEGNWTQLFDMN